MSNDTQTTSSPGGPFESPTGWKPLEPGELSRLLPGYEIISLLGRGGMGAVYYTVEDAIERPVALKILPAELSTRPGFADRFTREARAMARLNHPNIVGLYELGTTSAGHLFFTMEFVEGATLASMIQGPGLNPDQAMGIAGQICEALAYAHEQGVVHRDMKPSNILVDTSGRVKIADFGLARLLDPTEPGMVRTVTGLVMGTPDYMAPEQRRGMTVDHRADIYSLGVMLYEMLCQQTPQGAFAPPSKVVKCNTGLDRIVERALQPRPEQRYQSTTEMKLDVDKVRAMPPRAMKPSPWQWAAAGLLLTVIVIAGIVWRLGWFQSQPPLEPVNKDLAADYAAGWRDGLEELTQGRIHPEFLRPTKEGFLSAHRDVLIHLAGDNDRLMRNQAVRMKFRGLILHVQMRLQNGVNSEAANYSLHYDRLSSKMTLLGGTTKVPIKLAEGERPRPHDWFVPHDLEIRVINDLISVFLDGRQVIAKRDSRLSEGRIRISINDGSMLHRLAWIDLGDSTIVPPLSGWKDPATEPLRPVPEVATDQWRDGLALLEQGALPSAPFVRQSDGSYLVGEDDALLDLRASGASMPEDQVLRVKARGKGFRLEARRTDADASGKPFAFGFQFQSDPPKIALTTTYNRRPAEDRVNQTPPRGFNWDATHTLTMAVIGDRVSAWVDGEEMLTLRRSGPLAGHMAIRAAKGSVIEKVEFADLGRSGPPPLGVEQTLDGHRYRVVWAPGILWEDARAQAERLGGHLVTITHRKEQELISRMCSGGLQELGGGGQFWLGGARKGGEGDQWRWITGEPFAFTHWARGKPASSKGAKDLAITILSPEGGPGWNDWAGRNSREHVDPWIEGYVVEWSPR